MESEKLTELMVTLTNKLGEHERKMRRLWYGHIGSLMVFMVLVFIFFFFLYTRPLETDTCLKSIQMISIYYVIPCIIGVVVVVFIYLYKIKLLGEQEEIKADNVLKRKIEWENELSRMDAVRKEQDYSLELRRRVEGLHKNLYAELTYLLKENKEENERLEKLLNLYVIDKKE